MTIYLDVLIIINVYITYFLIKATAKFTHSSCKTSRLIFAAISGGLSSVIAILPEMGFAVSTIYKALICTGIIFIAFGFNRIQVFLKRVLFFISINFFFCGAAIAISLTAANYTDYSNGYFYIDVSLITLIISTIVSYYIIKAIRYFSDRKMFTDKEYKIAIKNNGKEFISNAMADTGNSLTDYFTGLPIIICSFKDCGDISPPNLQNMINNTSIESVRGIRIIPCSTINGSGIVYAFKPDKITIYDEKCAKSIDAMIGIPGDVNFNEKIIFNPKILI